MVLEKTLESPLDCKEIQPVHPKGNQSWIFIGRTDAEAEVPVLLATWCKELTHWKRPWCWEKLKTGGEGDDRGWDGWMALPTPYTWVWASSGSGWWTGKPGLLQSRGSQRVGHDWATELNWLIFMDTHTYHLIKTKINYVSSAVLLKFTFWLLKTGKGKGTSTLANSREEMNAWMNNRYSKLGITNETPAAS